MNSSRYTDVPTAHGPTVSIEEVMPRRRVTAKGWAAMVAKQLLSGAVIAMVLVGANGVAASAGSGAAQIGGSGTFDIEQEICDRGVAEELYPPILMTGDLNGCWYTDSFTGSSHPSGTYQETGTETLRRLSRRRNDVWNLRHDVSVRGQVRGRRVGDLRTLPAPHRFRKWHRGLRRRVRTSRLQGRRRCRAAQVPRPPEGGCGLGVKRNRISRGWCGLIRLLS